MIVEGGTGRSFAAAPSIRIIEALGPGHTSYPTSSEIVGPHVHGYLVEPRPPTDATAVAPADA